jgi:Arc/MetJ-type ribon-helix-helix transcriptional regulator
MRRRKHENAIHVSLVMPEALKARLVRRAARETADSGRQVTASDVVRDAIEEYLDLYEAATFVPTPPAGDNGKEA